MITPISLKKFLKIAGWGITTLEQETSNKCEIFFRKNECVKHHRFHTVVAYHDFSNRNILNPFQKVH